MKSCSYGLPFYIAVPLVPCCLSKECGCTVSSRAIHQHNHVCAHHTSIPCYWPWATTSGACSTYNTKHHSADYDTSDTSSISHPLITPSSPSHRLHCQAGYVCAILTFPFLLPPPRDTLTLLQLPCFPPPLSPFLGDSLPLGAFRFSMHCYASISVALQSSHASSNGTHTFHIHMQAVSPICIIHGPFGSGKSSLLVALVHYLLAEHSQAGSALRGCRVLLSAHTNIAVDRLMTGLMDTGCTGQLALTHRQLHICCLLAN